MTRFNLSEWAVNNKSLVVFLMLLCVIGGIGAYERLGRQEDPDFSVQTMVVQVSWPGATAIDTLKQVTDRIEKKLAGRRRTSTTSRATRSPDRRPSLSI